MRFLLILSALTFSCSSAKPKLKNTKSFKKLMEVHIHEKYNNDTLLIKNSECVLLNNEVLKTKGILPSTGIYFIVNEISKREYAFIRHRYQYVDTIYCSGNLDISFWVNGKKQNVELTNPIAPYVGIGRQDDSLTILESDKMFQYD